MKTMFVRGGTSRIQDREFARKVYTVSLRVLILFLISLSITGCFGERVSEQQHLDNSALAPGVSSSSDISPFAKRILERRPIVDRGGTILCVSKKDPDKGALRVRPYKGLFDHIIGYIDRYGRGLDGLEYVYDSFLLSKDRRGDLDDPLVLSVEKNLQAMCYDNLAWQMSRLRAKAGSIILMDVKTGQILAMANIDKRNKKLLQTESKNLAVEGLVNPWPVMLTIAQVQVLESRLKALEKRAGVTSKEDGKDVQRSNLLEDDDNPIVKIKRWHWHDFGESAAIWTRFDEEELDNLRLKKDLLTRLINVGFGQETGIDLPEEQQGRLPSMLSEHVSGLISSTASSTPIQILSAYTALLKNDGPVQPRLAMNIGSEDDNRDGNESDQRSKGLFGKETHKMLLSTFGDNGGPSIASYSLAECNGEKECYQVMGLGFWPANNPKVSYISVLFDAKYTPEKRRGTLGKMVSLARKGVKALGLQYRFALNKQQKGKVTSEVNNGLTMPKIMPDLRGMSIRSALDVVGRLGMRIRISGTGKVKEQYPKPGRRISKGQECVIVCVKGAV